MKNFLKLSLVLAISLFTISVQADEVDFLLFAKNKLGKQITFSINGVEKANIKIYDSNGNKIYFEKATGNQGIRKTYSLKELPSGKYILNIENDLKNVSYEITVTDDDAVLASKGITETYKVVNSSKELASN